MLTLEELVNQLNNIKSAANSLVISGVNNAAAVVFIDKTCSELTEKVNAIIEQARQDAENQNGSETGRIAETDAEQQFEIVVPEATEAV